MILPWQQTKISAIDAAFSVDAVYCQQGDNTAAHHASSQDVAAGSATSLLNNKTVTT